MDSSQLKTGSFQAANVASMMRQRMVDAEEASPELALRQIVEYLNGNPESFVPLLGLLSLKGKRFTLKEHFPMEPVFKCQLPTRQLMKCGRQVSKSMSLSAAGVLRAATTPFLQTLYVTPRFEQIRRLSTNYVRPLIRNSIIYPLMVDESCIQQVLQRSFINESAMFFSFCLLDVDRIRGLSVDIVSVDESICGHEIVSTNAGNKRVCDVIIGDRILCLDMRNCPTYDKVVNVRNHGFRDVWKLRLSTGQTLRCTDGELIATERGWTYAEDLRIGHVDGTTEAAAVRHIVGRRQHVLGGNVRQLSLTARSDTSRLLSSQSQDNGIVDLSTAKDSTELWLRERALQKLNSFPSVLRLPSFNLLPPEPRDRPASQTRDPGMAGPSELGRHRVLVLGRRQHLQERFGQRECSVQYTWLPQRGSGTPGSNADRPRSGSESDRSPQRPEGLLGGLAWCGSDAYFAGQDTIVRPQLYVVQTRDSRSGRTHVRVLRRTLYDTTPEPGGEAGLPEEGLPGTSAQGHREQVRDFPPRREESEEPRSLPCGLGRESEVQSRNDASVDVRSYVPSQSERAKARAETESGIATPSGHETLSVLLNTNGLEEWPIHSRRDDLLHGRKVSTQEEGRDQSPLRRTACSRTSRAAPGLESVGAREELQAPVVQGELQYADVVSVEYAGVEEVWDIETEKHHNFFANGILVHNCQDMDYDFIPIIMECKSHSVLGLTSYSGTPKTLDNTLEALWQLSSQGEWVIPCHSCGHWNMACVAADLNKMIGKETIVCAKCQKPVNPSEGHWYHTAAKDHGDFPGYHVPQPIMPLHYASPQKWRELLVKQQTYSPQKFLNEVLGESCDMGVKLITLTDIKAASVLGHNDYYKAAQQFKNCDLRILAVDWGGGGAEETSYTVGSLIGWNPYEAKIQCHYTIRMNAGFTHQDEAALLLKLFTETGCHIFAHDYGGSGAVRETLMIQAGLPMVRIMNINYVRATSKNILYYNRPVAQGSSRGYYALDKARSLVLQATCLKSQLIQLPEYESAKDITRDLLSLTEDKHEMPGGSDVYLIRRQPKMSDDFAHSLNFGCVAIWHNRQNWPDLATVNQFRLTDEMIQKLEPPEPMERG